MGETRSGRCRCRCRCDGRGKHALPSRGQLFYYCQLQVSASASHGKRRAQSKQASFRHRYNCSSMQRYGFTAKKNMKKKNEKKNLDLLRPMKTRRRPMLLYGVLPLILP